MARVIDLTPTGHLRAALRGSAESLGAPEPATDRLTLERPPRSDFGDYSSNVAMLVAGSISGTPRDVAARFSADLTDRLAGSIERVEVAGPGFVNLFLSPEWYRGALAALTQDGGLAIPATPAPQRVLIEFVSANPTGPLTAAGGRHAAYGLSLIHI